MIDRWHFDKVDTKESLLPVWGKPYHTNKESTEEAGLKFCGTVH